MLDSSTVTGWAEVLYRKDKESRPHNLMDLEYFQYEMVDNPLPLEEYISAYDIYEHFCDNKPFRSNRKIRAYDVVNLCSKTPVRNTSTLVVLDKKDIDDAMEIGLSCQSLPDRNHLMVHLPYRFRSIHLNKLWP